MATKQKIIISNLKDFIFYKHICKILYVVAHMVFTTTKSVTSLVSYLVTYLVTYPLTDKVTHRRAPLLKTSEMTTHCRSKVTLLGKWD